MELSATEAVKVRYQMMMWPPPVSNKSIHGRIQHRVLGQSMCSVELVVWRHWAAASDTD